MREIKFRAFYKTKKEMVYFPKLSAIAYNGKISLETMSDKFMGGEERWWQELSDLMQFTGLKDKNGKDVFEGDILSTLQYEDKVATVEWRGNHFGMGFSMCHDGVPVDMDDDWSEFEVIGNIYENPELISN